jgi:hypothetical protein
MARSAVVKVLMEPEDKATLEKAAANDGRTVSNLMEQLALAYLREKGLKR